MRGWFWMWEKGVFIIIVFISCPIDIEIGNLLPQERMLWQIGAKEMVHREQGKKNGPTVYQCLLQQRPQWAQQVRRL